MKDPANIETGGRPCVVDDGHQNRPIRQPIGSQDIAIQEDGLRGSRPEEGGKDTSTGGTLETKQPLSQGFGEETCMTSKPKSVNQGYSNEQPVGQSGKQRQVVSMHTKTVNSFRGSTHIPTSLWSDGQQEEQAVHIPASQTEPRSRITILGGNRQPPIQQRAKLPMATRLNGGIGTGDKSTSTAREIETSRPRGVRERSVGTLVNYEGRGNASDHSKGIVRHNRDRRHIDYTTKITTRADDYPRKIHKKQSTRDGKISIKSTHT